MELSKLSDAADAADAADERANVRKKLVLLGIVVVLAVGIYFLFLRTPAPPSAETLATTALTASDSAARLRAVAELGQYRKGEAPSGAQLERVVKESKDGAVAEAALGLLVIHGESRPLVYLDAMEHEDARVRAKAYGTLMKLHDKHQYPDLAKTEYNPNGPPESRKAAILNLRKQIENADKRAAEFAEKKNKEIREKGQGN